MPSQSVTGPALTMTAAGTSLLSPPPAPVQMHASPPMNMMNMMNMSAQDYQMSVNFYAQQQSNPPNMPSNMPPPPQTPTRTVAEICLICHPPLFHLEPRK